ncbi:MAG: hypothetical protein IBX63_07875 [Coriobacteriia bacterium]|nr:hypothetical protein [Coriobacteriia bacterium]
MTDHEGHPAGWEGYRALGLIANPYLMATGRESEGPGVRATVRAAAMRLLKGVDEALQAQRPRPVRVLKSSELPSYYPRSAMSVVLREVGADSETGLLTVYVPLIMMRKGRVRGTLSVVAEMVVGRSIDVTLGRYAQEALAEPDTDLPEWEAVSALDVPRLVAGFESDPRAGTESIFGAPVDLREDDPVAALEEIMRDSGVRQAHQAVDPTEDDGTLEESALDALVADVESEKVAAEGEVEEDDGEADAEEESESEATLVARYVIAHLRKHVSSVIARGVRAYVDSGTAAMAQELKVTKAPRKTLGALAAFAGLTHRSVVVLYDGFEGWVDIPEELRVTIVSGLSEVRYALGTNGVIVIAGSDLEEPDIDDQFATAVRVSWDMGELSKVEDANAPLDTRVLKGWLEDASLPGADSSRIWERVARSVESAPDLASGVTLASATIEAAAGSATATN